MSKREFLEILKGALSELPGSAVAGHVQYYEQYISGEAAKGLSEEEVTALLGDPRLIARTILETSGQETARQGSSEGQDTRGRQGYDQSNYGQSAQDERGFTHIRERLKDNPKVHMVLGILIVVAVIGLIFSIISALLPVVLPIAVVLFLLSYFRRKL